MILKEFGFTDLSDFLGTVFVFKEKTIIPFIGVTLSGLFATVSLFIDKVIYTPAIGIALLCVVAILDTILGAAAAVMHKNGDGISSEFNPLKISRAIIRFFVQVIFVGIFYQIHLAWGFIFYKWMVDALLIIFTISTFWSAFKNAHKLELISTEQYGMIEKIIDLNAIVKRFFGKKKDGD